MLISVVRLSGSPSIASSSWSGITSAGSSGNNSWSSSIVVDSVDRLSGPGMLFLENINNKHLMTGPRETASFISPRL